MILVRHTRVTNSSVPLCKRLMIQVDEFVTAIYQQTLFRKADQAGLDYWSGQLETGKSTADQIILNVV